MRRSVCPSAPAVLQTGAPKKDRSMDPMRTLLAAFVALSLAAVPRRAAADFETQAKQFKNSNALTQLADDENALDPSLDTAFVSIDVGIFDVRYLRSALSDAKHFDDLK